MKSVMSEQMALSLVRPHPFEAVLSPELSGVGVLKSPWRTWSLLGRQMIFLFLTLQGHLPGKSGPGNRVSVLEETPWEQICAGSRAHLPVCLRIELLFAECLFILRTASKGAKQRRRKIELFFW